MVKHYIFCQIVVFCHFDQHLLEQFQGLGFESHTQYAHPYLSMQIKETKKRLGRVYVSITASIVLYVLGKNWVYISIPITIELGHLGQKTHPSIDHSFHCLQQEER